MLSPSANASAIEKLQRKLASRKINGVVYPGDTPVLNALISIEKTEYAEGSMGYALAQTKADGTFSLTLLDDLCYLLKPVVRH